MGEEELCTAGWIAVFLMLFTSCLRAFAQRICWGPTGSKKNRSSRLLSMSLKEYFLSSTFCQFSSTWCFAAIVSFHSSRWLSSAAHWELMLNQVQSPNYSSIFASFAIFCTVQCSLLHIVSILWSSLWTSQCKCECVVTHHALVSIILVVAIYHQLYVPVFFVQWSLQYLARCVVYSEEWDHQLIHHCNLYLRCNMQISYHAIVLLFYRSNLISYKFCQIKTQHFLTGVEIFSAHTLRNRSSKFKEADLPPPIEEWCKQIYAFIQSSSSFLLRPESTMSTT